MTMVDDTKGMQIKDEFIEHRNHQRADRVHHALEQAGYLEGNPAQQVRELLELAEGTPQGGVSPALAVELLPEEKTLEMAIGDVVADLMHLAQREGLDWKSIQAGATMHFDAEQTEP
jgi:hypothetical protein